VPATVKALLASRIDRLQPEEKAVLQAAAVIGTDVPFGLLHAIAGVPDDQLRRHLVQLQSAEFMYETNLFPELEHTFKHALTHEVAYGTLLGDRRRALHARIVEAIERLYADRLSEQVEQLAHHAVRGEVWDRAVMYLREAGTKAFGRSTNVEAIGYFTQGLGFVAKLPPGREQMRQELRLHLALGPALQATRGFGVSEVERAYSRARELCEELGEPIELFQALWGLWLHTIGRGRHAAARPLAEELLAVAERLGDPTLRLEAHHAMSASTLWVGDPEATRRNGEHGVALYDREQHRSLAFLYGGHDPGVCCRMHAGLALWFLGFPGRALERSRTGLALARELSHPGTVVNALPFAGFLHQLRGDVEATREVGEALIALSTEHGFQQWLAVGRVLEGWVGAQESRGEARVARVRRAIDEYRATGNELYVSYFLSLLATTQLKYGEAAEGLETVIAALAVTDKTTGSGLLEPELYRLKGELLLARDRAAEPDAEIAFRQAIDIARRQGTKSWELRSALSLSRLFLNQGKRDDARRLLAEAYGWFTEGFDTPDLRDAKKLLDELSAASA